MGNTVTTQIKNLSDIGVKISLIAKDGGITDQELEPNETCSIKSSSGRKTVLIVLPVQDKTFTPSYTIFDNTNLMIVKQEGFLTLKRQSIYGMYYRMNLWNASTDHINILERRLSISLATVSLISTLFVFFKVNIAITVKFTIAPIKLCVFN